MIDSAVIIAGGKGQRLSSVSGDLPKPMVPVAGKPLLGRQLDLLEQCGIHHVKLFLGYKAEIIQSYVKDGQDWGLNVDYYIEKEPLGSAGGVCQDLENLSNSFFVIYGDTMIGVDLQRMAKKHISSGAAITVLTHPNNHPLDSDIVDVDSNDRVLAIHPYPHDSSRYYANLVNAALYVVERNALTDYANKSVKLDFAHDLLPELIAANVHIQAYRSAEFIKDMGTPARLSQVEKAFKAGHVRTHSNTNLQPAVFIDRDGTINKLNGFISNPDQLELMPRVADGIAKLNESGLKTILVSNQPVVARGECTFEDLRRIHDKLEWELGKQGAFFDAIYFCPHHPDGGFKGEGPGLKFECKCRKPATGMIDNAVEELFIDKRRSWMIGDSTRDIQTALNARIRSILVNTGECGHDGCFPCKPNYRLSSFEEAVKKVLESV